MNATKITRDAQGFAAEGHRWTSADRRGLFAFIHNYSGQRCVVCGRGDRPLEAGHLVPGGPDRMGYVAGNLASMCRPCNVAVGDIDVTPYIPMFALPECIPTEWPTRAECREIESVDVDSAHAADLRRDRGLPF